LAESDKAKQRDIENIKKVIEELRHNPIIQNHTHIYNTPQLVSTKTEQKIIDLLDKFLDKLDSKPELKHDIENIKKDIPKISDDGKARNRVLKFFEDLGDSNSKLHKFAISAGIAKKWIKEIINLIGNIIS
jgi:hypothetical protein